MKITVDFEECLKDSPRFRWERPFNLLSFISIHDLLYVCVCVGT